MGKNALLEIGTEEIPSSYIEPAIAQMAQAAEKIFTRERLSFAAIRTCATPRRLTLFIDDLAAKSEDRVEENTGPAAKVWRDAEGNYTPAAKGFAAKHGLPVEKLTVKQTEKGEYLCAVRKIPGVKAEKILQQAFPDIVRGITFPKTMVWEESGFRFARPLRSLVALYGDKVVRFSIAGIKAGDATIGLHTLSHKPVKISSPEKYITALKNACVLADQAERRQTLEKTVEAAAKRGHGTVIADDALAAEVTYLVEHPVAILGSFDKKYLAIPPEVLITCLRKKQKFFAVTDAAGKLTSHFIGVRNGISEHQDVVREGFECVLTARLADAEFFFKKDTATPLSAKCEKLKSVVFQQKIGSVSDKMARVAKLAASINAALGANGVDGAKLERACLLAKADLVTDMVFEYPELQGAVGRIYAAHDGEDAAVAAAVEQHYWPLSADGKLPQDRLSAVLSIADKIDTLVADFAIGLIPSGSQDPYGLRRMAVGLLRIILENRMPLNLRAVVTEAFALLPEKIRGNAQTPGQVMDFFKQRIENLWEAEGCKFDEIRAVVGVGFDSLIDCRKRLDAVRDVRSAQDFTPLAVAFKRAANILKQAEKNKIAVPGSVDPALLQDEAEKVLFEAVGRMEADVTGLVAAGDYAAALRKIVGLKNAVDAFFEKVMVMAEDQNVRANRLALLAYATRLFAPILDFSQLQGI